MPNFIIIEGYYKWLFPLVITLIAIVISLVFIEPFRKRIYNIEHFVKENFVKENFPINFNLEKILTEDKTQKEDKEDIKEGKEDIKEEKEGKEDIKEEKEEKEEDKKEDKKEYIKEDKKEYIKEDKKEDKKEYIKEDKKEYIKEDKKEDKKEYIKEDKKEYIKEDKKKDKKKYKEKFTNAILVQDSSKGIQGYNYEDYNTQYKSCVEMQKVSTKRNTQCESSLNKKIQEYEKMNVMYNYEPALLEKPKTSYYNGIGSSNESLFSNKK